LKFILNGKSYDLEGIDTNFYVNSRGSYVWKENPNANAWIWFNIGTRLPADALEKATGSLGVYEYACKSNQNCLTFSRIDIVSTEPLVAAAKAKLVAADGTTSANASAGSSLTAPTGVRRVIALLLSKTANRLQIFNAHDRSSSQCDFVWPYSGTVVDTQMAGSSTDRPQRGAITFIWTGGCNSNGMIQGAGQLYIGKVADSANDAPQLRGDPSKFIEQVEFDNGTQKGRIVNWRAQYTTDVDFSGNAENFGFPGVAYAKGSICHAIGFLSCRNLETIDSRFTWIAGSVHPSWYKDSSSGQSDEQCIWASRNYNSFYNQYKSFLAQGQCREVSRVAAEMKSKGGTEQSSYEEETC
jgi:hypothetical protein